jgi:hypothetical protein
LSARHQLSDPQRIAVIKAERELVTLEIILEHLDLSDVARDLLRYSVHCVRRALRVQRQQAGLNVVTHGD